MRVSPLLLIFCALAAAKKEVKDAVPKPKLAPAEIQHAKNMRFFFSIGEGFEGSASDWTEYAVWLIGVCGVFYYMANPNARRNPWVDPEENGDEADGQLQQPRHGADGDELFAAPSSDEREERRKAD